MIIAGTKLELGASLKNWILEVFKLAKQNRLISDIAINKSNISDEDLDRIWNQLFDRVQYIHFMQLLDPSILLKWLKTRERKFKLRTSLEEETKESMTHS